LIFLYTPVLKRIPVLKNAVCAFLVGMSIFFSGFSVISDLNSVPNLDVLKVAFRMLFLGSFSNEILLDISDELGDNIHNIRTLPTCLGKKIAWDISYISMYLNIWLNAFDLLKTVGVWPGIGFVVICSPSLDWIRDIRYNDYNRTKIKGYVKKSVVPMFLALIYLSSIAKFRALI
jgi:4-hydroxybenzoate polyprenyltransferase